MTRIGEPISAESYRLTPEPKTWFALFQCDNCGYCSLGKMTLTGSTLDLGAAVNAFPEYRSEEEARIDIAGRYFDRFNGKIHWIPKIALGKQYKDVPKHIASAASEAYSCFSIDMYHAAVLMARTALEATAKDCGITNGPLSKKIEAMAEKTIITQQLKDEADEIRLSGNDMAHADLDIPVTKEDAEETLGFLDSVLNYVYQQPMAVKKRRENREKRKQGKK